MKHQLNKSQKIAQYTSIHMCPRPTRGIQCKRLHDLPVLCHSLECEVTLFSLEKLCHRRFTKLYLLCNILIQGPGQIAYFVVQFYSWFLLNLKLFFSFVFGHGDI